MFRRRAQGEADESRVRELAAANIRLTVELAEARAGLAEARAGLLRAERSEARWMAVAAALGVLVHAIEGRWVPSEWWTLRPLSRRDATTDATLHDLRRRYHLARERTERP